MSTCMAMLRLVETITIPLDDSSVMVYVVIHQKRF